MWVSSNFMDSSKCKEKNIGPMSHNVFPDGLRVLVVADDPMSSLVLEAMLRSCLYQVCICMLKERALSLLQEDKSKFDVVIIDLFMVSMDDFKLVEIIGLQMELPVVLISPDERRDVVQKGIIHGACDYLIKPVRIEVIKLIWQHVVRKKKADCVKYLNQLSDEYFFKPDNTPNGNRIKRAKEYAEKINYGVSRRRKPRLFWTKELRDTFVAALDELGPEKAVPKRILECMTKMGVHSLTKENIASHLQGAHKSSYILQKYRDNQRRLREKSKHQGGDLVDLTCSEAPKLEQPSSYGCNFQGYKSLAHVPHSSTERPPVDKINFSFGAKMSESNSGIGKQANNNDSDMNLLHELPTTTETRNPGLLPQDVHSLGRWDLQVSGRTQVCMNTPSLEVSSSTKENNVYLNGQHCLPQTPAMVTMLNECIEEQDYYLHFLSAEFNSRYIEEIPSENMSTIKSNGATRHPLTDTGLHGYCFTPNSSILDYKVNEYESKQNIAQSCGKLLLDDDQRMGESSHEPLLHIKHVDHDDILSRLLRQYSTEFYEGA